VLRNGGASGVRPICGPARMGRVHRAQRTPARANVGLLRFVSIRQKLTPDCTGAHIVLKFFIDTDHLLRALLRERTPTSLAIEKLGISLSGLRSAAVRDRTQVPANKSPWYWKPPFLRSPS